MIRKKYKIDVLKYNIVVSITSLPKRKVKHLLPLQLLSAKYFFVLFSIILMILIVLQIKLYDHDIYYIKTSPLLERISPVLGKHIAAPTSQKIEQETEESIIFSGSRVKRKIALTFDADMTPEMKAQVDSGLVAGSYNKDVVDILYATKTKATFFMSGLWLEKYPDISKSFAGTSLFELANHSYSHPSFEGVCYGLRSVSEIETLEEIVKTQRLLKEITGRENKYFRFPGGCYSEKDLATVQRAGVTAIQWDVEGRDGFNFDPRSIEENILTNVKNGSIIVLHMNGYPNSPVTAQALPRIIAELRIRDFEFVTVSELLEVTEETPVFTAGSSITENLMLSYK